MATLYRLRGQIELIFKEWKSYANLHRFDTSKDPDRRGPGLASALEAAAIFLLGNARRAHPARDRDRGRLAPGLRPVGTSD